MTEKENRFAKFTKEFIPIVAAETLIDEVGIREDLEQYREMVSLAKLFEIHKPTIVLIETKTRDRVLVSVQNAWVIVSMFDNVKNYEIKLVAINEKNGEVFLNKRIGNTWGKTDSSLEFYEEVSATECLMRKIKNT